MWEELTIEKEEIDTLPAVIIQNFEIKEIKEEIADEKTEASSSQPKNKRKPVIKNGKLAPIRKIIQTHPPTKRPKKLEEAPEIADKKVKLEETEYKDDKSVTFACNPEELLKGRRLLTNFLHRQAWYLPTKILVLQHVLEDLKHELNVGIKHNHTMKL